MRVVRASLAVLVVVQCNAFAHVQSGAHRCCVASHAYVPDGLDPEEYKAIQRKDRQTQAKKPRTFFDLRTLKLEDRRTSDSARDKRVALSDAQMWRRAGALSASEAERRGAAPKVDVDRGAEKKRGWWPW